MTTGLSRQSSAMPGTARQLPRSVLILPSAMGSGGESGAGQGQLRAPRGRQAHPQDSGVLPGGDVARLRARLREQARRPA